MKEKLHRFTLSSDTFRSDLEKEFDFDYQSIVNDAVVDNGFAPESYKDTNEIFWDGLNNFIWTTFRREIKVVIGYEEREVDEASGTWIYFDFLLTDDKYIEMRERIETEIWGYVEYLGHI